VRDKCLGEYDTIVDDTPTSPNMKEQNWEVIQPLLAVFKDQLVGNPQVLVALLEYSPLPSRVVEMLKKFADAAGKDPEELELKQLNKTAIVARINKDQSTAEMQNAKAGSTQATAMYDVAMARNLLEKNDISGLSKHLEQMQKAADLEKTMAETEQAQAKKRTEHANAHATHMGAMTDALSTVHEVTQPPVQPGQGA
jgi:hypothetical protein